MKVYCIECNTPIEVDTSKISDSYIPPDLCTCVNCNQEKDTDPGLKELEDNFDTPKIYKELRKKEQEEINQHRWFMSEKLGYFMQFFNFPSFSMFSKSPKKGKSRLDEDLKRLSVNGCKAFVNSNLMATFSCPCCDKSRQMDVSKFLESEKQVKLKCKCSCKHIFSAILERRRSFRKEKFFHGHMVKTQRKDYVSRELIKSKIIVKNISIDGIRIKTLEKIPLKKEEIIEIEFKLNDPKIPKISREVRMKNFLSPVDIGCEFLSNDHYGYLGEYFAS
jgi:hypothetical protein